MIVDLHVVAPKPDSDYTLPQVIEQCIRTGLDGVCLVATCSTPPIKEAMNDPLARKIGLFFGVEFAVERGHLIWIPKDISALEQQVFSSAFTESGASFESVTKLASNYGGVIIAVHPYERSYAPAFADGIFGLTGIDAIEVATATSPRIACELAFEAAMKMKVRAVGGSGKHAKLERIGSVATVFPDEIKDQNDLVNAIAGGDTWIIETISSLRRPYNRQRTSGRARFGQRGESRRRNIRRDKDKAKQEEE